MPTTATWSANRQFYVGQCKSPALNSTEIIGIAMNYKWLLRPSVLDYFDFILQHKTYILLNISLCLTQVT